MIEVRPVFKENTLSRKTGSWRDPELKQKPRYLRELEVISPCAKACLAGNNIPAWLHLLSQEKYHEAWELLVQTNPLPTVTARVCPHPGEDFCNRGQLDESLAINVLERFLGDEALRNGWQPERITNLMEIPSIAIVGSGPAGLSCAFYLGRRGYPVTIFERSPEPGGMLRTGIPEWRLPKDVLKQEIENNILSSFGIKIQVNTPVDKEKFQELKRKFRMIVVAVGAHQSKRLAVPGEELPGVLPGLELLRKINFGQKVNLGKRVVVIGGGNTAIDAARCALRQGAQVSLVYRRTKEDMPAFPEEIEAAEKEGVEFHFLAKPAKIVLLGDGQKQAEFLRGQVTGKDQDGRSKVSFQELKFQVLADSVITAIGESSDLSFVDKSLSYLYLAGDAKDMLGTVGAAIKSGREVAESIDHYLKIGERKESSKNDQLKVVQFEDLNLAYFRRQKRKSAPHLEAKRCFACGLCRECENCFNFCPEPAIKKTGDQGNPYTIDLDYCKGCGICAKECPRGVIVMEEENESQ